MSFALYAQQSEGISADAVRILLHAGLMKRDEKDVSPTHAESQFLLLDTAVQVWFIILQYLNEYTVKFRHLELLECLTIHLSIKFFNSWKRL